MIHTELQEFFLLNINYFSQQFSNFHIARTEEVHEVEKKKKELR